MHDISPRRPRTLGCLKFLIPVLCGAANAAIAQAQSTWLGNCKNATTTADIFVRENADPESGQETAWEIVFKEHFSEAQVARLFGYQESSKTVAQDLMVRHSFGLKDAFLAGRLRMTSLDDSGVATTSEFQDLRIVGVWVEKTLAATEVTLVAQDAAQNEHELSLGTCSLDASVLHQVAQTQLQ